jgi:hypothetical protein
MVNEGDKAQPYHYRRNHLIKDTIFHLSIKKFPYLFQSHRS